MINVGGQISQMVPSSNITNALLQAYSQNFVTEISVIDIKYQMHGVVTSIIFVAFRSIEFFLIFLVDNDVFLLGYRRVRTNTFYEVLDHFLLASIDSSIEGAHILISFQKWGETKFAHEHLDKFFLAIITCPVE